MEGSPIVIAQDCLAEKLPPSNEPLLWTAAQVAERLQISPRMVWSLTAGGELPAVRIRRCVRYRPEDVRAYRDSLADRQEAKS